MVYTQSSVALCDPMDCSPPDSSVHGILQARVLEWVAISFTGDLSDPGIEPISLVSPALAGEFLTFLSSGLPAAPKMKAQLLIILLFQENASFQEALLLFLISCHQDRTKGLL